MSEKIKFEFDDALAHQAQAIDSTVKLFDGLPKQAPGMYGGDRWFFESEARNPHLTVGSRMLENLRGLQLNNNIFSDSELCAGNFGIEMETGTGKTYVYLRSILRLHEEYGFKKFMIVVPSIAIRKGVEKSIAMLQDHFSRLHNLDILKHSFVYNSSQPGRINQFIDTHELDICVINRHAFASDVTKIRTAGESDTQSLWEDLKDVKPIIIMDEPQVMEGSKNAKSKSLQAMQELNPLFVLKYSATHKKEFPFNLIYKLDSYDAFTQDLVKRIQVKTVYGVIPKETAYVRYVAFTKELKARIEIFHQEQGGRIKRDKFDVLGNASLYELSGNLPQYEGMRVAENPHKLKPLKIANGDSVLELELESSNCDVTGNEAVRIQIRLAIQNHLDKQFSILDKGEHIKTLSLFFIDSVSNIRDDEAEDGRGAYLKIFDETYQTLVESDKYKRQFAKYADLFPDYADVLKAREGYFARDKKSKATEVQYNKKGDAVLSKSQEDIDRGIQLILDKKDELISFKEPLAFIFSHSALREGWDNPNIFTLCTLKNSHNEIAKKQEIGRGLRLPVNVHGKRILDPEVNELTVIANDHYDHFANTLQKDFNENMGFNKDEVTHAVILNTLKEAGVPERKITAELVDTFKQELVQKNILNDKNLVVKGADVASIEFTDETLVEHASKIKESFVAIMTEKGTKKVAIKNGDEEPVTNQEWKYVAKDDFEAILSALKQHLAKRSIYSFELDQDAYIQECVEEINEYLKNVKVKSVYQVTDAHVTFDIASKIVLEKDGDAEEELFLDSARDQKTDLQIIDHIMYHTMLPRLAIIRILKGVERRELLNYQDFLEAVTQKIATRLVDTKAANIQGYEIIDGYELDSAKLFEADVIDEDSGSLEVLIKQKKVYQSKQENRRALHQFYKMDSNGEYDFAQNLESNPNIFMYTKLKKGGFVIETPYGNYSPDWTIVYKAPGEHVKLFFIVETKADKEWSDLTPVEQSKINCGKNHFEAVSSDIKFDWVNSYKNFKDKFAVTETA